MYLIKATSTFLSAMIELVSEHGFLNASILSFCGDKLVFNTGSRRRILKTSLDGIRPLFPVVLFIALIATRSIGRVYIDRVLLSDIFSLEAHDILHLYQVSNVL